MPTTLTRTRTRPEPATLTHRHREEPRDDAAVPAGPWAIMLDDQDAARGP
jgi:hypothetical protein